MRVICLVPSLTETLIEAGVNVVGRTRFCIHPAEKVKNIPIVGGTKNIDWDKVQSLQANIIILDKEENPKSFADQSPIPFIATHIQDISTCIFSLKHLAQQLQTPLLDEFAARFEFLKPKKISLNQFANWITNARENTSALEYIIWKDPIMAVSKNTFIGSVLKMLGHEPPDHATKYPKLPDQLNEKTTYLFSSEPFPFAKNKNWIQSQNAPAALVDGESFSWFGIRSLRFLESLLHENRSANKQDSAHELNQDDLYYNELGYMVFTKEYHLRRGYCCKSGCLHCPYGFKKIT